MQCQNPNCLAEDRSFHVHPVDGRRYCHKCWSHFRPHAPTPLAKCSVEVKKAAELGGGAVWKAATAPTEHKYPDHFTTEIDRAIAEASSALTIKERALQKAADAATIEDFGKVADKTRQADNKVVVIGNKPQLYQCSFCGCYSNDGGWLDVNLYYCHLCMEDLNTGGEMSSKHIKLKLRGGEKAIAFFHYVCSQIDTDWPWKCGQPKQPCSKCGGVLYVASVLNAEDIRAIAKHAGLGKCKIPYFGDVINCFSKG